MNAEERPTVTRRRLVRDLTRLGICPGQTVMLHASVKEIGWIVGGPNVVIQALLDVLTPAGTLMMLVSWEDSPYEMAGWPKERQRAYLEECPPFDPATSPAFRRWSILTEYLRTWPGACRSDHPESSFAAVGAAARWITADHPLQYGHGPGSPLGKLYEADGHVLLLGAQFGNITLLHYAEHLARVPDKPVVRYKMPVLQGGERAWVDIEEFDTNRGVAGADADEYFQAIPSDFLDSGHGCAGKVGAAQAYLFPAKQLVDFAVEWLEQRHGTLG